MQQMLLVAAFASETEALPSLPGAFLHAWSCPPLPLAGLVLTTTIYLRGWQVSHRTRPAELPAWRAVCFLAGAAALWIAIASPVDALDDYLLAAHMIQHFILMSIAPPLIVLGAPTVPLLRGLPRAVIRRGPLHHLFASRRIQATLHRLSHPALIWCAMNVAYLGWHAPAAFELTFSSEAWHNAEHLCFFLTSVAFWWVILCPWPTRSRWPWAVIPYLLSADIVNTILSALLTFSGRVLYSTYEHAPRVCSLTPLQDQIAAGSEMWVLNSTVFLVPALLLTLRMLSPASRQSLQEARPGLSDLLTSPHGRSDGDAIDHSPAR